MPMRNFVTAACALALGIAWSAAPALAQETTKEKAERKAQRIEQKGEQKAEETKAKADEKADKVRAKAADKTDASDNKVEHAWDKTKEMTDKVQDKVSGTDRDMRMSADVRAAQQALRDEGFDAGPADGKMGPKTTAALKEFQQKNNLTVTGTLDAETRDHLLASSAPSASPGTEPSRTGAPKK